MVSEPLPIRKRLISFALHMRLSNEELLQEKIDLAEMESNDLEKIEAEKKQFDALQQNL